MERSSRTRCTTTSESQAETTLNLRLTVKEESKAQGIFVESPAGEEINKATNLQAKSIKLRVHLGLGQQKKLSGGSKWADRTGNFWEDL